MQRLIFFRLIHLLARRRILLAPAGLLTLSVIGCGLTGDPPATTTGFDDLPIADPFEECWSWPMDPSSDLRWSEPVIVSIAPRVLRTTDAFVVPLLRGESKVAKLLVELDEPAVWVASGDLHGAQWSWPLLWPLDTEALDAPASSLPTIPVRAGAQAVAGSAPSTPVIEVLDGGRRVAISYGPELKNEWNPCEALEPLLDVRLIDCRPPVGKLRVEIPGFSDELQNEMLPLWFSTEDKWLGNVVEYHESGDEGLLVGPAEEDPIEPARGQPLTDTDYCRAALRLLRSSLVEA